MHLEELPTEILYAISQEVAAFGASPLVDLTRASRKLHAVSNPVLYSTDVRESGGLTSMHYGLKTALNNVVSLCLSAGADPNLRFESPQDLDSCFPPISPVASHRPGESNGTDMGFPVPESHLDDGRIAYSPSPSEDSDEDIFNLDAVPRTVRHIPFQSKDAFYWTPLHVAATRDDIKLLSLLLDHGANPNSAGRGVCICHRVPLRRTYGRSTPFCRQNDSELLERRLVTRWSPLHVAVCKGSLDCAEELVQRFGLPRAIESDEDVIAEAKWFFRDEPTLDDTAVYFPHTINTVSPRFDPLPPLHVATSRYTSVTALDRVYTILQKVGCLESPNSGIDVLDAFGDTPFAVAAFSGRIQILGSFLRDHGADINFVLRDLDGSRRSVFNALCKSGLFRNALYLMDLGVNIHRDVELHSRDWHKSALHYCCGMYCLLRNGRTTAENQLKEREAIMLLKRLIHAGVDINARAERGTTPLMFAANTGFTDAVRELLDAKADVGVEDDDGEYALRYAVEYGLSLRLGPELDGALLIIQLLLDFGADPNQRSEKRGPPLFTRQFSLGRRTVNELESLKGSSASFAIPRNSMVSIAPLLTNNGADPNIYLEVPEDIGKGSFEEQLENFGWRSLAVSAFYSGELDSLNALVASGTVVTLQDYLLMMRSVLYPGIISSESRTVVVEALFRVLNCSSMRLERPKDRGRIMDAWTEVLYLAVGSRPTLVHALAPHICLTNMRGPGGKTVLHLMAQWERKKNETPDQFKERMTEMMLNLARCGAGRQIDQPDNSGRSPLHLAGERGNIAVVKHLVGLGASLHIEHRKPDGSTTISPLRSAIRSYSKGSQFKVATNMLQASIDMHGSTDRFPGNLGLLKEVILHFGRHTFDKPARMAARTTELMENLFSIGVNINEADEQGNTALHHLIQLLYSSDESSKNSFDQGAQPSQSSSFALRSFLSATFPRSTGPERFFQLSEERDMHLNGHNLMYESDSDYDFHPDNYDQPEHDIFDDDSDISDITEYAETAPPNELGELVNHDPRMASDRCDTWMSTFFLLLVNDASLTTRNDAGKKALDYIEELIGCQPPACPKMYSPVIPALREFVKRPPFDPELLAKLDDPDIKVKGRPLLLVHDKIHMSMDENGPEEAAEFEREAATRGETCWTPFW